MLVPWSWLRQWVEVDGTPEDLAARLPFVGLPVEEITTTGGEWDKVVVGEIRSIEPHPNADRLTVCQVETGDAEPRQIVCGATNMAVGDHVLVALPGAVLGDLKIKKSKLRGEVSAGMMCSPRELGLGDDPGGLLILDRDTPVGAPATDVLGAGETVLELEITPNRGDCLSVRGVAREVAILAEKPLAPLKIALQESGPAIDAITSVTLEDPDGCPRYTCRVVDGIAVGPSPAWLADAITACGVRPINSVVDATNYVMLELGQPLHAFDLDKLAERRIIVRRARPGERIITLDGTEQELDAEMTVIADAKRPVAIAGVMGGLASAVTDGTKALLLESAYFDPARVRRTARQLKMATDSSHRFERGVDIAAVPEALDRLAQIIAEVAGGTVAAGRVDAYPAPHTPPTISLRIPHIARVLGLEVAAADARRQLEALGCTVADGDGVLQVTVPSWRSDLTREIDLVEEIARLTGYDKIPATLPAGEGHTEATPDATAPPDDRVRDALAGAGFSEVIGFRFVPRMDAVHMGLANTEDDNTGIRLLNPLSEDRAVMRRSCLPTLIRIAGLNQRNGHPDLRLFEVGTEFHTHPNTPREETVVGGVLAGRGPGGWWGPGAEADVYDAKGAWETLADTLGLGPVRWEPSEQPYFQRGAQAAAVVGDTAVGWAGALTPEVVEAFEAQGPMFAFLLNLDEVASRLPDRIRYSAFSRFPPSLRSRTYDVPEATAAADVQAALEEAGGDLLERVQTVDVFRGGGLGPGVKSLTYALTFRAGDRTLNDAQVDAAIARLDRAARKQCGATVREA